MQANRIQFDRPCPFRVCDLEFDAKGKCTACGLPVVDLSAGTEDEAENFLASGARSCVAFAVDRAGKILFGRGALTITVAAAAGAALAIAEPMEPAPQDTTEVSPLRKATRTLKRAVRSTGRTLAGGPKAREPASCRDPGISAEERARAARATAPAPPVYARMAGGIRPSPPPPPTPRPTPK